MKPFLFATFIMFVIQANGQTLQLHYDTRHSINPKRNPKNFPTLYFEYFKTQDSGRSFIKPGSFLLKMQADFSAEHNNMSKFFMQVSQTFRCWKPNVFINLQYSGGMGITEPRQYSYYILNTYAAGIAYPFKWHNAYLSTVLNYRYAGYKKPSHDFLYTLYWWQGLFNYKAEFSGDFSLWTENKNHGDDFTKHLNGKRFFFFAEPQFWYRLNKSFAAGTKLNLFFHVNTTDDILELYPTLAVRCRF